MGRSNFQTGPIEKKFGTYLALQNKNSIVGACKMSQTLLHCKKYVEHYIQLCINLHSELLSNIST